MLQSMGSQSRTRLSGCTELSNWTELTRNKNMKESLQSGRGALGEQLGVGRPELLFSKHHGQEKE